MKKTYHAKINQKVDDALLRKILVGVKSKEGEILSVKSAKILREGTITCWLEIVLDEGKNRQIRKIFETLGIEVLRLVRVAIGKLKLGDLKKGEFRFLIEDEVKNIFND